MADQDSDERHLFQDVDLDEDVVTALDAIAGAGPDPTAALLASGITLLEFIELLRELSDSDSDLLIEAMRGKPRHNFARDFDWECALEDAARSAEETHARLAAFDDLVRMANALPDESRIALLAQIGKVSIPAQAGGFGLSTLIIRLLRLARLPRPVLDRIVGSLDSTRAHESAVGNRLRAAVNVAEPGSADSVLVVPYNPRDFAPEDLIDLQAHIAAVLVSGAVLSAGMTPANDTDAHGNERYGVSFEVGLTIWLPTFNLESELAGQVVAKVRSWMQKHHDTHPGRPKHVSFVARTGLPLIEIRWPPRESTPTQHEFPAETDVQPRPPVRS